MVSVAVIPLLLAHYVLSDVPPNKSALWQRFVGYSISSLSPVVTSSVTAPYPIEDVCVFMCAAMPGCFAATFFRANGNGTCAFLQNCGHIILDKNDSAVTYAGTHRIKYFMSCASH